eukprot:TRINITY_DN458_c0_g1_i1.p1 TRINITY_DN458_c0_g1~~TRINITY_DN458_c0_g1_i1.p1  ORF type:complete len:194 (+),score=58.57 TRINITY_DN458_c0_g1_i1:175-756(+)
MYFVRPNSMFMCVVYDPHFVDHVGDFIRGRPAAQFLTQEDLEHQMWKRSKSLAREYRRKPNLYAGQPIPTLPTAQAKNRSRWTFVDISEGNNHPFPPLTVRDQDGTYRWATEYEYEHEVDNKRPVAASRAFRVWRSERIRRRQMRAGIHRTFLHNPPKNSEIPHFKYNQVYAPLAPRKGYTPDLHAIRSQMDE